mmetsp:Transcript_21399/g.36490  ORF Transcript_21399/g.36490 Transcript_21399/m.36490 type:complete len:125 (-) Transcript_21399:359-733(-)|eukprot:CAMPEP_0119108922 /NCGR_PEP_ID=MMETSP1180-20130426/16207_1 /TAXON_ID=3052 ORGANISM="Chlamydomonas cf sp, Strain CCMP681" /NCGR_SAMPLE_ID=MMETSP1180 /ASSEMBLY_ACC=CAM_ASM_000741 /LENGTH=124 /DNA_ID=CAMNT_0007094601 /DNA_START=89 /DNA_END=463 /DNA_ORIENTATION=+
MSLSNEAIIRAERVSRLAEEKLGGMSVYHEGVRVRTASGGTYILHGTTEAGTVVTPAAQDNWKDKWKVDRPITLGVGSRPSIGDVLGGPHDAVMTPHSPNMSHPSGLACVNTADEIESILAGSR